MSKLESIRLRLAWWLHPNITRDEVSDRAEQIEYGLFSVMTRAEAHEDLVSLLEDLGVEPTEEMKNALPDDEPEEPIKPP
jgi:hypothetical protein